MTRVKITRTGQEILIRKIMALDQLIKEIQSEKAIAYTASGDGWHDNPGFNQLEQKEFRTVKESQQLKMLLDNAQIIEVMERNTDKIQIGSIVTLEQEILKSKTKRILKWEVVGHLESDIKANKIAYDTPVGSALLGKREGDKITLDLPVGEVRYLVVELHKM